MDGKTKKNRITKPKKKTNSTHLLMSLTKCIRRRKKERKRRKYKNATHAYTREEKQTLLHAHPADELFWSSLTVA